MENNMSTKISILIADDEPAILLTLEKLIVKTFPDLKVFTASNGKDAWEIIKVKSPSIVLSDINMPIMDGIQLLIKVRADENFNNIVFILLTGNTDAGERIKALDKGADEFITKPVVSVALEARIRSAIRIVSLQEKMKEENHLLMGLADELEKDLQDLVRLAVKFMQARIPTSQDMLSRVSAASVWIAQQLGKFSNEDIRNIELAAFLSHAGRMTLPDRLLNAPVMLDGKASDPLMMQVPHAAREIVSGLRRFGEVGKILYSIYENFDGSGFPGRLQSWQIPFPSRIIRVALDYEEIKLRTGKKPKEVIQILHSHSSRLYDNRIVVLMEHFARSNEKTEINTNEVALLLTDLQDGMVLSRDIITEKNLKLLPAGAVLREHIINKIISHNSTDPILGNIYVLKNNL